MVGALEMLGGLGVTISRKGWTFPEKKKAIEEVTCHVECHQEFAELDKKSTCNACEREKDEFLGKDHLARARGVVVQNVIATCFPRSQNESLCSQDETKDLLFPFVALWPGPK